MGFKGLLDFHCKVTTTMVLGKLKREFPMLDGWLGNFEKSQSGGQNSSSMIPKNSRTR